MQIFFVEAHPSSTTGDFVVLLQRNLGSLDRRPAGGDLRSGHSLKVDHHIGAHGWSTFVELLGLKINTIGADTVQYSRVTKMRKNVDTMTTVA